MLNAQTTLRTTPALNMAMVSDSNLFARASVGQADVIARLTPSMDVDIRSHRVTLSGRVSLDAERFAANTALTTLQARRFGGVDLRFRLQPRLTISSESSFLTTTMPGELNAASGLVLARGRASRVAFSPAVLYRMSPRTESSVKYAFTHDRLEGAAPITTAAAAASVSHRVSRRNVARMDYEMRRFRFAPADVHQSHALSLGWTYTLTRRFSMSVSGGPRLGDGGVAPEYSAAVMYRASAVDLALSYNRVQTTLIGLAGTADAETLSATAAVGKPTGLRLRITPAVMTTSRHELGARVARVGVGGSYPLSRALTIDVAYDATFQRGDVYVHNLARIARHVTAVSLVLTPAGSAR
jgi:hypothetical protein